MWTWFVWDFWPYYGSNGFDVAALGYRDIAAWASMKNRQPAPFEVDLLLRFDAEFRSSLHKKNRTGRGTPGVKNEVDASNTAAVGALLQGFRARAKEVFGKPDERTGGPDS